MRKIDNEIAYVLDRVSPKLKKKEFDVYWVLRYERTPLDNISTLARKANIPRTTFLVRKKAMEESLRKLILEEFGLDYVEEINRRFFEMSKDE